MSTWNKKNFSIYTSDERSALGLIEELGDQTNYNTEEIERVKESDNKKVSHDEMNNIYKIDKNANFTGSWHGISKPTASQEGLQATVDKIVEDIPFINEQLDTKTQQLEISKASKTEVDIERKRIDNLTKIGEGSTTGDAELIDGRIGADGVVYSSLGDGIRSQFKNTNNTLNSISMLSNEKLRLDSKYIDGCYVSYNTGQTVNISGQSTTEFIYIGNIDSFLYVNTPSDSHQNVVFYDSGKNKISGYALANVVGEKKVEIPSNAVYFRGSFFNTDKENYYVKGYLKINNVVNNLNKLVVKTETNKFDFEVGTINPADGFSASSTQRIRTTDYLSSDIYNLKVNSGYSFVLFCYDNNNYIGCYNDSTKNFSKSAYWLTEIDLIDIKRLNPNYRFRVLLRNNNSSSISIEDSSNIIFTRERFITKDYFTKDNKKIEEIIYYIDGINGSDSYNGSIKYPFKTINKAISQGGSILYVASGTYKESISVSDLDKFKIYLKDFGYYGQNGNKELQKIIIDNSTDIAVTNSTEYMGLLENTNDYTLDSYMYKVFISKELEVINNSYAIANGDSYNVTMWEIGDDISVGKRLIPKLTIEECQAMKGSFFYNGSKTYINPSIDNATYKLSGDNSNGLSIVNCKNVVLEDVVVKFSRNANILLNNCNNLIVRNCEADYSAMQNGFRIINVNGEMYKCRGYKNRGDGFTLMGYGCLNVFNLEGAYNEDDGFSPHDGCYGSVNNSTFHNNVKAGLAPVNGANYDMSDIICYNNQFGFLCTSSSDEYPRRTMKLMNCIAYDNQCGICTSRNDFYSFNSKFVRNTEINKQIINTSTFTELNLITD